MCACVCHSLPLPGLSSLWVCCASCQDRLVPAGCLTSRLSPICSKAMGLEGAASQKSFASRAFPGRTRVSTASANQRSAPAAERKRKEKKRRRTRKKGKERRLVRYRAERARAKGKGEGCHSHAPTLNEHSPSAFPLQAGGRRIINKNRRRLQVGSLAGFGSLISTSGSPLGFLLNRIYLWILQFLFGRFRQISRILLVPWLLPTATTPRTPPRNRPQPPGARCSSRRRRRAALCGGTWRGTASRPPRRRRRGAGLFVSLRFGSLKAALVSFRCGFGGAASCAPRSFFPGSSFLGLRFVASWAAVVCQKVLGCSIREVTTWLAACPDAPDLFWALKQPGFETSKPLLGCSMDGLGLLLEAPGASG